MTPVRTVSPSCLSRTTVACKHCHSEALVCGVIGEATERMGRELAALHAIADAAREWLAAEAAVEEEQAFGDSGADLCDVDEAVTRARARVADALATLNGDAS